jgi:hypothetical protein
MTKSLNIQKPPKKSACDPKTRICLRALQNDPCDYYEPTLSKKITDCIRLGITTPMYCINKKAWLNDQA